uniref:Uncharacterized protein n=1 Tax=Anguilla anguilla TaxID=7936 RepID=A0A0E9SRQ2_ANGAN
MPACVQLRWQLFDRMMA